MVSRTAVMSLSLALTLSLSACSSPADDSSASNTPPASTPSSSTSPAGGPSPASSATPGDDSGPNATTSPEASDSTDVSALPKYITPYPDAEVVSSSVGEPESAADSAKLVTVSLVMRATAEPKHILKHYTKLLQKADFETYGDEVKTDDATVVNFRHKKNDGLLTVTVGRDPQEKKTSVITIGGKIAP